MTVRLGYACLNTVLREDGVTPNRDLTMKTFKAPGGFREACTRALMNIRDLQRIIEWNAAHGFQVFRITSSLFPKGGLYRFEHMYNYEEIKAALAECGRIAREAGIRLSAHPRVYTKLASLDEEVVQNAIIDLEDHGWIFDQMGMPRSYECKMNIHVGGAYDDKEATAQRFLENFATLSDSVKSRLVLENDDRGSLFTVTDLYDLFYLQSGIPITFDFHHHNIHPGGLSTYQALRIALSTWPAHIRPCTHYSESRYPGTLKPAHSDYVDGPIPDFGLDFDCVVEAKMKDAAVRRLWAMYPGRYE
jgi:UV DNA damage endonuclease